MRIILHLLLASALVFLSGCLSGSGGDRPVPRRVAYPRVEAYDSVYVGVAQSGRVNLEVNASAVVSVPRDSAGIVWIDVRYPRYNAVLHLTLAEASGEALTRIAANREERFARDTEGMRVTVTEVDNDFAEVRIGRGHGQTVTPLHLMATDGATFFLSGALELNGNPSSVEVSFPVVDAVYNDMVHFGRTLRRL